MDKFLRTSLVFKILTLVFVSNANAEYNVAQYCQLVKVGTKLPSSENCQSYYTCFSSEIVISAKCSGSDIFDKNAQGCVPKKLKSCKIDSIKNGVIENMCDIMENEVFFGDFEDCQAWHKCNNDKIMSTGQCPDNYGFDVDLRSCVSFSKSRCKAFAICEEGERRGDQDICSKYQECRGGKWHERECKSQEYFDTLDEICKDRRLAKPTKTCDRCQYSTQKWVNAVDEKCRDYFVCKDGVRVGSVGTCIQNSYFNEERQACLVGAITLKDYARKNGVCLCDWQCELEKCSTKKCQQKICANLERANEIVRCKQKLCELDNSSD